MLGAWIPATARSMASHLSILSGSNAFSAIKHSCPVISTNFQEIKSKLRSRGLRSAHKAKDRRYRHIYRSFSGGALMAETVALSHGKSSIL